MKLAHLLLDIGVPLFVVHIGLSLVLRGLIGWKSELVSELFAFPDGSPFFDLRLLRFKYFKPWQPRPKAVAEKPATVRLAFTLTRASGAAAGVCLLGLIANVAYVAFKGA